MKRPFGMVLFALLQIALCAPAQTLKPDQEALLERARTIALQYTQNLPNFLCTQTTHRSTTRLNPSYAGFANENFHLNTDVVVETLTWVNHREHYQPVSLNGIQLSGMTHRQLQGALSEGEFGSLLVAIFHPESKTTFRWSRHIHDHGRNLTVFQFHIPREAGSAVLSRKTNEQYIAASHGQITVDADSGEVTTITQTLELPFSYAVQLGERTVEYQPVSIAGKLFNLPVHSESHMQERSMDYLNRMDFTNYQHFASTAKISFEDLTPADTPAPAGPPTTQEAASVSAPPPAPVVVPANTVQTSQPAENASAAPQATTPSATPLPQVLPPAPVPTSASTSAPTSMPAPATPQAATATPPPATTPGPTSGPKAQPEFTLQMHADQVLVPVVVLDSQEKVTCNLEPSNFAVYDGHKQQVINSFHLESSSLPETAPSETHNRPQAHAEAPASQPATTRELNLVLYLFDDLHLNASDSMQLRAAAKEHLQSLYGNSAAAVMTTSGKLLSGFTNDRTKLIAALDKLSIRPSLETASCPHMNLYLADLILNVYNPNDEAHNEPLHMVTTELMSCRGEPHDIAKNDALSTARSFLAEGRMQTESTLHSIRSAIAGMSRLPGRKSILIASPGFIVPRDISRDVDDLTDLAIRSDVVLNTLDARGLYTPSFFDASNHISSVRTAALELQLSNQEESASGDVLAGMANETGGIFFHNSNDLRHGLDTLATPSACVYVLGFQPANLKMDGSYHPLKVRLTIGGGLHLRARKGYYAPEPPAKKKN